MFSFFFQSTFLKTWLKFPNQNKTHSILKRKIGFFIQTIFSNHQYSTLLIRPHTVHSWSMSNCTKRERFGFQLVSNPTKETRSPIDWNSSAVKLHKSRKPKTTQIATWIIRQHRFSAFNLYLAFVLLLLFDWFALIAVWVVSAVRLFFSTQIRQISRAIPG